MNLNFGYKIRSMEIKNSAIFWIAASSFLIFQLHAFTTSIHAPAVLLNQDQGTIALVTLNVTSGNGTVTISGPANVGNSTIQSAETAAAYAARYTGVSERDYNFNYNIADPSSNVSGPSAGLAFTLLAISNLEHRQLYPNFTVTGTIGSNGNVGEIGGVYDKMQAAKEHGMQYALVPYAGAGQFENLLYYITQQKFGIPMVEVSNVSEALRFAYSPENISGVKYYLPAVDYHMNSLPQANVTCSECNLSYFYMLVNYTLGYTANESNAISAIFPEVGSEFLGQIENYSAIEKKGYLYTAADLAFTLYPDAYLLANSDSYTPKAARGLIENVSGYCASLTPPQLTSANYEYVIGGELRQIWGEEQANASIQLVNTSQTSDQIIEGLDSAATSEAWCNAAGEMYSIASSIGGQGIMLSPAVKQKAIEEINSAKAYGFNIYEQSAMQAYNSSEYGAAVYAAAYANILGNPDVAGNYTSSELVSMIKANAANSTFGIWPSQFANSALFYMYQANSRVNDTGNLTSAYSLSLLAKNLNDANKLIASTEINVAGAVPSVIQAGDTFSLLSNQTQELQSIYNGMAIIYSSIFMILIVMVAILIFIIAIYLKVGKALQVAPKKGRRNG